MSPKHVGALVHLDSGTNFKMYGKLFSLPSTRTLDWKFVLDDFYIKWRFWYKMLESRYFFGTHLSLFVTVGLPVNQVPASVQVYICITLMERTYRINLWEHRRRPPPVYSVRIYTGTVQVLSTGWFTYQYSAAYRYEYSVQCTVHIQVQVPRYVYTGTV